MKCLNTLYYGPFLKNKHYNDSYYFADVNHPFLVHLSRVVSQWVQAKQGIPDVSFSTSAFLLLLGNPEVFLFRMIYNPCSELKSRSRKHPYPMMEPPQLSPFDPMDQKLYSELPLNV